MKIKAIEFICWALKHAKRESIPYGAEIPLPTEECGTEPWHYLFGTVKAHTTPEKIAERWENFYSRKGWSAKQYNHATENMQPTDYATDCAGLLDAFLCETIGKTDKSANIYYVECTEKGEISSVDRPYALGEPVFMAGSGGRMHHIGFVCGFLDGEPLIVEARGLSYGVVVTKFSERKWTHRGLLTEYFIYGDNDGQSEESGEEDGEGTNEENGAETGEDNEADNGEEDGAGADEENDAGTDGETDEETGGESGEKTEKNQEPVIFEHCSPMIRGEKVKTLQILLNETGYRDEKGNVLKPDGKFGKRSFEAFRKFITAHAAFSENAAITDMPDEISVNQQINGCLYEGRLVKQKN